MGKYNIFQEYLAQNVSKSLLVNVNISIIMVNKNYIKEIHIQGDPLPSLREEENNNIFLKFKFKEIKPREEKVFSVLAAIETKEISKEELLYTDIRKAVTRQRIMLIYPEGLRRIRKISERLFRKSKLLIDFEEEIINFIERNFSAKDYEEKMGLEHLLSINEGNKEDIIDFIIALHKNAKIPARKVHGFIEKDSELIPHVWFETRINKIWVPIDPFNKNFGKIKENYIAKKVEYTEKMVSDYLTEFKSSKKIYSRALYIKQLKFALLI